MTIKFDDQESDYTLPLTEGELSALSDILDHAHHAHRKGKARMSSAEIIDVQSLREKVADMEASKRR